MVNGQDRQGQHSAGLMRIHVGHRLGPILLPWHLSLQKPEMHFKYSEVLEKVQGGLNVNS